MSATRIQTKPQRIASEYNWKIRQVKGAIANLSNLIHHVSPGNNWALRYLKTLEKEMTEKIKAARTHEIKTVREMMKANSKKEA